MFLKQVRLPAYNTCPALILKSGVLVERDSVGATRRVSGAFSPATGRLSSGFLNTVV